MKAIIASTFVITAMLSAAAASAMCEPGAYGSGKGDFVVVVSIPRIPPPSQRYLFRDGRRGSTTDASSPVACEENAVTVRDEAGRSQRWPKLAIKRTATQFTSVATTLAGELMEPAAQRDPMPLVAMVHGSEARRPSAACMPMHSLRKALQPSSATSAAPVLQKGSTRRTSSCWPTMRLRLSRRRAA